MDQTSGVSMVVGAVAGALTVVMIQSIIDNAVERKVEHHQQALVAKLVDAYIDMERDGDGHNTQVN